MALKRGSEISRDEHQNAQDGGHFVAQVTLEGILDRVPAVSRDAIETDEVGS